MLIINYWLMAWKNAYSWLSSLNFNNNVRICSYEKLCNDDTMYEKVLIFVAKHNREEAIW